jgi:hypothetical protein
LKRMGRRRARRRSRWFTLLRICEDHEFTYGETASFSFLTSRFNNISDLYYTKLITTEITHYHGSYDNYSSDNSFIAQAHHKERSS